MVSSPTVTVDHLVDLQSRLIPALATLRNEPVWIDGSTPLDAQFVASPSERVPELLDDFVAYLNAPTDTALIAAARVHAAFVTIHPFRDGNGRVGRALIHTVLAREGLTGGVVLPVSVLLWQRRNEYYQALQAWHSATDRDQRSDWFRLFAEATLGAVSILTTVTRDLTRLREEHLSKVSHHRSQSKQRELRADAVAVRIIEALPRHPVMTVPLAASWFAVSEVSARTALELLADAGVVTRKKLLHGKAVAYRATEVLALADAIIG